MNLTFHRKLIDSFNYCLFVFLFYFGDISPDKVFLFVTRSVFSDHENQAEILRWDTFMVTRANNLKRIIIHMKSYVIFVGYVTEYREGNDSHR